MSDEIKLIRMRRDEPQHGGGPTRADVHPLEVDNFKAGGWTVAEKPKEAATQAPTPRVIEQAAPTQQPTTQQRQQREPRNTSQPK